MGDRYWISGVQLGMLKACMDKDIGNFESILREIEEEQFVGRIEEEDKGNREVKIVGFLKNKEGEQ